MSRRSDEMLLTDILEASTRISRYIDSMNYDEFLKDIKTQDAVVRNIEIIGEAVKELSEELKQEHSEIEWRYIARMRDKLIHHYHGVNWEIVWSVVKNDLVDLKSKIDCIIS